jgi:hypothetical protein
MLPCSSGSSSSSSVLIRRDTQTSPICHFTPRRRVPAPSHAARLSPDCDNVATVVPAVVRDAGTAPVQLFEARGTAPAASALPPSLPDPAVEAHPKVQSQHLQAEQWRRESAARAQITALSQEYSALARLHQRLASQLPDAVREAWELRTLLKRPPVSVSAAANADAGARTGTTSEFAAGKSKAEVQALILAEEYSKLVVWHKQMMTDALAAV